MALGREGPTVQMGASIAHDIAPWLVQGDEDDPYLTLLAQELDRRDEHDRYRAMPFSAACCFQRQHETCGTPSEALVVMRWPARHLIWRTALLPVVHRLLAHGRRLLHDPRHVTRFHLRPRGPDAISICDLRCLVRNVATAHAWRAIALVSMGVGIATALARFAMSCFIEIASR